MSFQLDHRKLWAADWSALCRLAMSLGLRLRSGEEGDRRGPLIDAMLERMIDLDMEYYRARAAKERRSR